MACFSVLGLNLARIREVTTGYNNRSHQYSSRVHRRTMAPKSILPTMACREDPARRVHAESKTQLKIIIFEIEKKRLFDIEKKKWLLLILTRINQERVKFYRVKAQKCVHGLKLKNGSNVRNSFFVRSDIFVTFETFLSLFKTVILFVCWPISRATHVKNHEYFKVNFPSLGRFFRVFLRKITSKKFYVLSRDKNDFFSKIF